MYQISWEAEERDPQVFWTFVAEFMVKSLNRDGKDGFENEN